MENNPNKDLLPLERRPDGSLYRMTPTQRKWASTLIRWTCSCCEGSDCIALDDGDACTCPQAVSFSACCKRNAPLCTLGWAEVHVRSVLRSF